MVRLDLLVVAGPLVGEKKRVQVDAEDIAGVLAALGEECGVADRGALAVSLVVAGSERAEPVADITELGAKAKVSLRLAGDFSAKQHDVGSRVERRVGAVQPHPLRGATVGPERRDPGASDARLREHRAADGFLQGAEEGGGGGSEAYANDVHCKCRACALGSPAACNSVTPRWRTFAQTTGELNVGGRLGSTALNRLGANRLLGASA